MLNILDFFETEGNKKQVNRVVELKDMDVEFALWRCEKGILKIEEISNGMYSCGVQASSVLDYHRKQECRLLLYFGVTLVAIHWLLAVIGCRIL